MDLQSILSVADELVFARTGKHLDNLQADILKGTLTGQKYADLAKEHNVTRGHIKDIASDLWKILSEELGEDIKKGNVIATLERLKLENITTYGDLLIGNINNVCNTNNLPSTKPYKPPKTPYIDLDDAPTLNQFYGRKTELNTLETWIIQDKTRLIAISGLSGIGKTTLTLKLIETIQNQFNYIIYRNLNDFANLDELLEDLISIFLKNEPTEISTLMQQRTLIKYLRNYRCLIILDNGQALLKKGELTGTYQPSYQNFSQFFQQIGETNHQSCLILNSWETPKEIQTLAENKAKVQLFSLKGLGEEARNILRDKDLKDEDSWAELIAFYDGHPQWLKWVAIMILELWEGNIRQAWQYQKLLLPDELKTSLDTQIQRLSTLEQQILTHLSQQENSLTLSQLLLQFNHSPSDICNAIQSLKKRGLIEKNEALTLSLVIQSYLCLLCKS